MKIHSFKKYFCTAINGLSRSSLSIICLLFLSFCSCNSQNFKKPRPATVQKGLIDLRNWNFERDGVVNLTGKWALTLDYFLNPNSCLFNKPYQEYAMVPGKWQSKNGTGFGTYQLCVLLPKEKNDLALKINDIATAYTLFANGQKIMEAGTPGTDAKSSIPLYAHPIVQLSGVKDTLLLTLYVSNFYNYEGGILSPIQMGTHAELARQIKLGEMFGNFLIGALLFAVIFHLLMAFFQKKITYHKYFAAICFLFAVHLLCMNERWLYDFLGAGYWTIANHIEFITIIGSFLFMQITLECYLELPDSKLYSYVGATLFSGQIIFVVVAPVLLSSLEAAIIPFDIIVLFLYGLTLSIIGIKRKKEESTLLFYTTLISFIFILSDGFFLNQHVGGILFGHYGFFLYVIAFSIFLSWQSAKSFRKVELLTVNLSEANNKLEIQNENLENIIKLRTTQLIEIEKEAHLLELEKKQKDMEAVSANNRLKQEVSRKMILELVRLNKTEVDFKLELNKLISSLKQQYQLDEKLNTLQKDPNKVNADFMDRLTTLFPDLTKSEREICSLIRLNISNKDMGILLKTSTNAINVTRSRLRKKLNLSREVDMEIFISKI